MERAEKGPADQWGGHLRRAGDKGRHGLCATVLAVCGAVSVGGHEAHLSLERRGRQVRCGQG